MKMKLFIILVISVVLVSSFAASVLPSANALTTRTDFSNRHTTATWGNSHVCGDHKCKPGEQSQWGMKISAAQRGGNENLKQLRSYAESHGKGMTPTVPGTIKMSEKMSVGDNMTDKGMPIKSTK